MLDAVFVLFLFWFEYSTLVAVSSTWTCTSHCRSVLALRGQSFWDVQDARRTPKNTAVMLVALCCSSGFPLKRGEALRVLGFVSVVLASALTTSDVPCQVSCWEREICPVFFCSWSGHDVFAGLLFRRSARCSIHVRNSAPSVPQAPKGVDDGGAAASVVSSHGVCGGVVTVRITILFPLYVMFASLP